MHLYCIPYIILSGREKVYHISHHPLRSLLFIISFITNVVPCRLFSSGAELFCWLQGVQALGRWQRLFILFFGIPSTKCKKPCAGFYMRELSSSLFLKEKLSPLRSVQMEQNKEERAQEENQIQKALYFLRLPQYYIRRKVNN